MYIKLKTIFKTLRQVRVLEKLQKFYGNIQRKTS